MGQQSTPFGADSRLADAIAADPAVVERLIALDAWFGCLTNPPSLRAFSALATIRDAAAAANVAVASVLSAINAGQTALCCACQPDDVANDVPEAIPAWMAGFDAAGAARIDVRPLLAAHLEPFAAVMQAANAVPQGGALIIHAPFNPRPLRRVLEGKGFKTYAERCERGDWRILCVRSADSVTLPAPIAADEAPRRTWRAEDGVHIDVRGLEAPAPLTAILTLIAGGEHEGVIVVHHHREPLYLYPELDDRGWGYTLLPGPPDEVRLELRRRP